MGHLQQAVAFFQQNQQWTTQVKDLSISATYLLSDMMTTALIPTIFQYISHIKFTDVEPIAGSLLEDARLLANTRHFIQFRNNLISWKNLTHIVDGGPSFFDVTKSLLNSTTLNNLGYLELSFPRRVYHGDFAFANSRSQADFKHFLNSIQNAPNLNQLVLKEATVQLADIKKLHDKTPNLLDLKFEEVRLSATDDEIEQVSLTAGQENTSSPLRSVELGVYSP